MVFGLDFLRSGKLVPILLLAALKGEKAIHTLTKNIPKVSQGSELNSNVMPLIMIVSDTKRCYGS